LSGTTTLTRTGTNYEGHPYFEATTDNKYTRSCGGGGTYTNWYLNELERWTLENGLEKKDFEGTLVENWSYRWPTEEHAEAGKSV
jgi:hypothetical protein